MVSIILIEMLPNFPYSTVTFVFFCGALAISIMTFLSVNLFMAIKYRKNKHYAKFMKKFMPSEESNRASPAPNNPSSPNIYHDITYRHISHNIYNSDR